MTVLILSRETVCVNWVLTAQSKVHWQALVNTVWIRYEYFNFRPLKGERNLIIIYRLSSLKDFLRTVTALITLPYYMPQLISQMLQNIIMCISNSQSSQTSSRFPSVEQNCSNIFRTLLIAMLCYIYGSKLQTRKPKIKQLITSNLNCAPRITHSIPILYYTPLQ
jgi:hypothetical protein